MAVEQRTPVIQTFYLKHDSKNNETTIQINGVMSVADVTTMLRDSLVYVKQVHDIQTTQEDYSDMPPLIDIDEPTERKEVLPRVDNEPTERKVETVQHVNVPLRLVPNVSVDEPIELNRVSPSKRDKLVKIWDAFKSVKVVGDTNIYKLSFPKLRYGIDPTIVGTHSVAGHDYPICECPAYQYGNYRYIDENGISQTGYGCKHITKVLTWMNMEDVNVESFHWNNRPEDYLNSHNIE